MLGAEAGGGGGAFPEGGAFKGGFHAVEDQKPDRTPEYASQVRVT